MVVITLEGKYPCPECGGVVEYEPDCPGYPGGYFLPDGTYKKSVMVCNPWWACGGADHLACASDECDWWYREPNNRSLDGYKYNRHYPMMGVRPNWFDAFHLEMNPPDDEDAYEAHGVIPD